MVSFGNSSITLKMIVRNKRTKKTLLSVEKIVFVALNEFGEPAPHGVTKFSERGRWKQLKKGNEDG